MCCDNHCFDVMLSFFFQINARYMSPWLKHFSVIICRAAFFLLRFQNACRRKVCGREKEVTTEIIALESHDCRNVTTVKNSNEAVTVGTRTQKFEYGRMSPKSISFINLPRGSRQHSHAQLLDILICLTFIKGSSLKTTLLFREKFPPSL